MQTQKNTYKQILDAQLPTNNWTNNYALLEEQDPKQYTMCRLKS